MPEDPARAGAQYFCDLRAVLNEAGGTLADIVRLQNLRHRRSYCEPVMKVQGEVFRDIRPAATIVVVAGLSSRK